MTDPLSVGAEDEHWAQVEAAFTALFDTPPEARESRLASLCSDESVRTEVRRLLARHASLSTSTPDTDDFLRLDRHRAAELLDDGRDPATIGRYQILGRVGRGATGVVYLARDPSLDRRVAIKLLAPHLSDRPDAVRRFAEEARTASALDHPHIATIHEIGHTSDGRLFITMAYYEGETLRNRLGRGALPVDEAVRFAGEIADGLCAAHARNIVHRDIKPENILLTPRGACIVDFGIAKVLGHTLTRTGAALGTAAYMSPEQTRGTGVDHRSDLWSLGVVLYEMLTGVRPFQADGGEALVYAIRHDAAEPVTARRADVAPAVARIVDRCFQKEPERRYQSAGELLAALRAPTSTHGSRRLGRRLKRVGLAVAVVVVAAAAVLAVPKRLSPGDRLPLTQLSTVLPPSPPPGAIAVLSLSEHRSDQPLVGPPRVAAESTQYLTAGIVGVIRDELIRGLSATPSVRVSWRPSVRILTDAGTDIQTMGRRLGVTAVLQWSLRHRDDLITVDARLTRAADRRVLWSHSYQRPVREVGAIPEEIRRSVVGALGLNPAVAKDRGRATSNLAAADLYLRGQFAHSKYTPAGLDEAAVLFRQAIARDSGFALAYLWLADAYMRTWSGAPVDRSRRVKPLVAKALELDSTLGYAHRMAGQIAMWHDRDWVAAERHLSRALALDSSDIWNYHTYAAYLAAVGRMAESVAIARRATVIDPLSSVTAAQVGYYLFCRKQYADAIAVLERAMEVDTTWWKATPLVLGRAYLAVGQYDDAIRQFRRAGLESAGGFEGPALLAYGLGIAGRTEEADAMLVQYAERARASSARPVDLVAIHLGLRDTARALDWVEQIPGDRGSRLYLINDPMFDPLRESPRFQRVLEQLNLLQAAHPGASPGPS